MTPAQVAHIMPPLPKPLTLSRGDEDGAIQLGYTAEQMQAYARAAVEAALRDAPQAEGWVMVPAEIVDQFPEISTSNYDHDDACALNAWGVELVLAATPTPHTEAVRMSEAEIDAITKAQWGEQIGAMYAAYRAYARAVERAVIGRAGGGTPTSPEREQ